MKSTQSVGKKSGRPKGSKSKCRDEIVSLPACCPRCRSTNLRIERKVDGGAGECRYPGTIDGQQYTHTEFHHARCAECGQYLRLRTFAFDGKRLKKRRETIKEKSQENA